MVEDDQIQEALSNVEHMDVDQLTVAVLTHVINSIKDDLCITSITASSRNRDITIWASCDAREENFSVECQRDDFMQMIFKFTRMCYYHGKSETITTRKFQMNNPSFTPDTLVELIHRFYRVD